MSLSVFAGRRLLPIFIIVPMPPYILDWKDTGHYILDWKDTGHYILDWKDTGALYTRLKGDRALHTRLEGCRALHTRLEGYRVLCTRLEGYRVHRTPTSEQPKPDGRPQQQRLSQKKIEAFTKKIEGPFFKHNSHDSWAAAPTCARNCMVVCVGHD